MRIVFMGTPDFAVPCLAALLDAGHEVAGVFTQPDKPKGRGHKLAAPPVKQLAIEHDIPVWQPQKLRDGEALAVLRTLAPELLVVVAYGRILPTEILELPKYGCINVHGSLLPKYRGAAPIQWSVLNGDATAGVTTMYLAQGMDTGDMIFRQETPIGAEETSAELYARLAPMGAALLVETVAAIATGSAPRIPQDDTQATLAPMLSREMAEIDFTQSAAQVHHLICGLNPWPVARTTLEGRSLKVYRSRPVSGAGEPGHIIDEKELIVACGTGAIALTEIQSEGGKRLSAADYLRGRPVKRGEKVGS